MRRPTLALSSALAAIGLSAAIASAQQPYQGPSPLSRPSLVPRAGSPDASSSADPVDPMMASKATRYLLRNGMDYLAYREYARALSFFRAVESRQKELSPAELDSLKKGIARAQQGLREAVNATRVVAQPTKGRPNVQPGGFALAKPPKTDPVQLASAEVPTPTPPPLTAPTAPPQAQPDGLELPNLPSRMATPPSTAEPLSAPTLASPSSEPSPAPLPVRDGPELAPAGFPPPIGLEPPGAPELPPAQAVAAAEPPPSSPASMPADPATTPASAPADAPLPVADLPGSTTELPPGSPLSPPVPTDPASATSGPLEPIPASASPARVALAQERGDTPAPIAIPPAAEPPPAPEAGSLPRLPASDASPTSPSYLPTSTIPESILPPRLRQELDQIAQRPSGTDRPGAGAASPADPNAGSTPSQGSTRLELQRAPSPTEARPIRRIPVPEEYVPLGAREWNPNRKYWAAAGTCHMTLYFQDPVLERYGQGVEQSLGTRGRFFSYPLDDPRQSNQRNQILQPFYSIGKFCFQVGTLPYKFLVDPPWESEYDLGYYRPGDPIPPDTIYITPTGVGPPLKGRQY